MTRVGAHVRQNLILIVAIAGGVATLIGANYVGTNDRSRIEEVARDLCETTEKLKAQHRLEALEDYENLDRNGRLLGIEITPELRATARESRDATLRRFAPSDC